MAKTIQLISPDKTVWVDYETDLIGSAQELTSLQIKDKNAASTQLGAVRLSDAAVRANVPQTIDEFNLIADFSAWATTNKYSMKIYEDGQTTIDSVDCSETNFNSFSLAEQTGAATINTTNHTIAIEVESGTTVTALVATFDLSYGATAKVSTTAQVSGVTANNFTSPVTYAITAEDGSTSQNWTVTVTVAS